ncbi:MAG: NAD(P)/FAD-dependent oxidoreductase [Mycoplasmatales bacterium]
MNNIDIVIIGAGPVGLFAGFYAGMRGLKVLIVDTLPTPGGQLSALYPEKYIYDIAGFDRIKAQDLVDNLLKQLKRFETTTTFALNTSVENIIKKEDNTFEIQTSNNVICTKSIIIASGNGIFSPRKLGLKNEENCQNIHYSVNNIKQFTNKDVAIFGGGDSAVDWALMLEKIANKVYLIHRREEFRAHQHSVTNLKNSTINILTPFVPTELIYNKDTEIADSVIIKRVKTDNLDTLKIDDIICNYGFLSNLGPIKNWNLELEKNKILVDYTQKTNIDGVFAIGDICTYPGKAVLIATGFGEAPIAINSAFSYINPDATLTQIHSSHIIEEDK